MITQLVAAQQKIDVAQIVDGTFSPDRVRRVNWMNDGNFYTALDGNRVNQYSIQTGQVVKTLVDGQMHWVSAIDDYEFSADEGHALLLTRHDKQSIYRQVIRGYLLRLRP